LNTALKSLGVSMQLTRPVEHKSGGSADRLANGILISVNDPAFPGSHFDITLASTCSAALATLPVETAVSGLDLSSSGNDLTGSAVPPAVPASSGTGDCGSSPLGILALGPHTPGAP